MAADSAATALADSLALDSLRRLPTNWALTLSDRNPADTTQTAMADARTGEARHSDTVSWVVTGLLIMFCITAVKFRTNSKYLASLMHDLTETRARHNMFDDTVRETSFLVLLNILWCLSAGALLNTLCALTEGEGPGMLTGSMLCIGIAFAYDIGMWAAYNIVGQVFSDTPHTRLWVKGFVASQALAAILIFPVALLCILQPTPSPTLLITAGILCIIPKIIFLCKGFRIFFTQITSWVLFLYYLCSLEIVPLILAYVTALFLRSAI